MENKYIKKVAIVGAGGNSGSYMAEALLRSGKHSVTAITRSDSNAELPSGILVKKVDYNDKSSLVSAMHGQEALVITLSAQGTPEQKKLIHAAAEAGVSWILPNEWSPDAASEDLERDLAMLWQPKRQSRELIEKLGKSAWICITTGFWYEWSLSIPFGYGFDFDHKSVTLYDDGNTYINTTTWPQVGRAVANLLSLPLTPANGTGPCLEQFRNKHVYVSSFRLTQNDMLDSVLRVTSTQRSDWKIDAKPSKVLFEQGAESMKKGDMSGMGGWLYGRVFFPDGTGDYETSRGLHNEELQLPKEDLDEATKRGVDRANAGVWKKMFHKS